MSQSSNHILFKILETLELSLQKNAETKHPFENTYEDFFQTYADKLTFSCGIHNCNILTDIFTLYLYNNENAAVHLFKKSRNQQNKSN